MILASFLEANLLSWAKDFLTERSLAALGAILLIYLGVVIKKKMLPLLEVRRNREIAEYLLVIADDVTDYFRLKFPTSHWSVWLDKAIDRIIEITGVGRDTAERAAKASLIRKQQAIVSKPAS
jgi:hypothetical protein